MDFICICNPNELHVSAICAYSLVDVVQHDVRFDSTTYGGLQILSISFTDTTHLKDHFDKIYKNYKDRNGSNEPNLLKFNLVHF